MEHNIRLLVLPPHTSHLLQPLDMSVFGPLKTHLSRIINRITRLGPRQLQRPEWVKAYYDARDQALRPHNIWSGFRNTGLSPYNPSIVL